MVRVSLSVPFFKIQGVVVLLTHLWRQNGVEFRVVHSLVREVSPILHHIDGFLHSTGITAQPLSLSNAALRDAARSNGRFRYSHKSVNILYRYTG